ncbi:hypothetical protein [Enterovirga sp. CN4-39]|uniref:hypothetical protein n=1 Tax=Enterovirga sp. CN4-39 TaxID=3400910 RepID=UPI003C050EA1
MADPPIDFIYAEGTITLTNGSDIAVGQDVAWDLAVLPYDIVFLQSGQGVTAVREVLAPGQMRIARAWAGETLVNAPYFVLRWIKHTDPRVYGARVSSYLTRLKNIPEDGAILQAIDERVTQIGAQVAAATAESAAAAHLSAQAAAEIALGNLGAAALIALLEAVAPLLPTSLPAQSGKLWNAGGVLAIS